MIKWRSQHCILFATKEFKGGERRGWLVAIHSGPICFVFTSKRFSAFIVYVEGLIGGVVHKCSLTEFSQIIKLNNDYGLPCGTYNINHNDYSQGIYNPVEER